MIWGDFGGILEGFLDGLGRAGAVWEMSVRGVFEELSKGVLSLSRIWGGGGISWRERGGDIGEKSEGGQGEGNGRRA